MNENQIKVGQTWEFTIDSVTDEKGNPYRAFYDVLEIKEKHQLARMMFLGENFPKPTGMELRYGDEFTFDMSVFTEDFATLVNSK